MTECVVSIFNRMDSDNLKARFKNWCDWLQRCRYIENDRYLYWLVEPEQMIVRPSKANPTRPTDLFTFTIRTVSP